MAGRNFWPEDRDHQGGRGDDRVTHRQHGRGGRTGYGRDADRAPMTELPTGGYQPPGEEGARAFDPSGRGGASERSGQRGMPEGSAEEIAAPFDEDRILDRVDRDHRGRGPKGYRRSDERILEEVSDRLADDRWVDASEIEVRVEAGEVTLTGMVDSRTARRRAEDLAEGVRGVAYVQNNLRARDPFYHGADRAAPPQINAHATAVQPTGAGGDATTTSGGGVGGTATAGTGAVGGGDGLLGSEETSGRRYAQAPIDRGGS